MSKRHACGAPVRCGRRRVHTALLEEQYTDHAVPQCAGQVPYITRVDGTMREHDWARSLSGWPTGADGVVEVDDGDGDDNDSRENRVGASLLLSLMIVVALVGVVLAVRAAWRFRKERQVLVSYRETIDHLFAWTLIVLTVGGALTSCLFLGMNLWYIGSDVTSVSDEAERAMVLLSFATSTFFTVTYFVVMAALTLATLRSMCAMASYDNVPILTATIGYIFGLYGVLSAFLPMHVVSESFDKHMLGIQVIFCLVAHVVCVTVMLKRSGKHHFRLSRFVRWSVGVLVAGTVFRAVFLCLSYSLHLFSGAINGDTLVDWACIIAAIIGSYSHLSCIIVVCGLVRRLCLVDRTGIFTHGPRTSYGHFLRRPLVSQQDRVLKQQPPSYNFGYQ